MEAYTNIKIEMENKEAANAAMEIMKAEVEKYRDELPRSTEAFMGMIKVEGKNVVHDGVSIIPEVFEKMIPNAMKAIANNDPNGNFKMKAFHETTNNYLVEAEATFENRILKINMMTAAEGNGYCPDEDCEGYGDTIVFANEYEEGKTYICPYCGKEYTAEEVFDAIPYFEEIAIEF